MPSRDGTAPKWTEEQLLELRRLWVFQSRDMRFVTRALGRTMHEIFEGLDLVDETPPWSYYLPGGDPGLPTLDEFIAERERWQRRAVLVGVVDGRRLEQLWLDLSSISEQVSSDEDWAEIVVQEHMAWRARCDKEDDERLAHYRETVRREHERRKADFFARLAAKRAAEDQNEGV